MDVGGLYEVWLRNHVGEELQAQGKANGIQAGGQNDSNGNIDDNGGMGTTRSAGTRNLGNSSQDDSNHGNHPHKR